MAIKGVLKRLFSVIVTISVFAMISTTLLTVPTVEAASNTYQECLDQDALSKLDDSNEPGVIWLNTNVPFVGRCIIKRTDGEQSNATNALPKLLQAMIRIAMTVVVVTGFLGILVGGFMITGAGAFGTAETGKKIIIGVIAGLILLGASGIILSLVNPDFFTTT